MKDCKRCNSVKPFSEFGKNKRNISGYNSYCKACQSEYQKERYEKTYQRKHPKEKFIGNKKYCSQCKEYKELLNFKKISNSWCIKCQIAYDKEKNATKKVFPEKIVNGMINCRWCKEYLPKSSFGKGKTYCRQCSSKIGHTHNIKRFKLTPEQYIDISNSQNGVCKICGEPEKTNKRLSIDHDHTCCHDQETCGKCTRGLICSRCNKALGMVNDDIELLKKMIAYLS